VVVLAGGQGTGKTLAGERAFQEAIQRARQDPSAPVPVIVHTVPVPASLHDEILRLADGAGDPRRQGAALVVEADQVSSANYYLQLLAAIHALVSTWRQGTTALVLTRPLPFERSEVVATAALTREESARLVNLAAGQDVLPQIEAALPDSVLESLDRPLFALLLGGYIRRTGHFYPRSTTHLIAHLAEELLDRMGGAREQGDAALRLLARKTTDLGRRPVPLRELGLSRPDIGALLATGAVIEEEDSIRFTLPILADWFAADAIRKGEESVERIASSVETIERWRHPSAVALVVAANSTIDDAMEMLSRESPGQAAEVLKMAEQREKPSDSTDPLVIGRRVYRVMGGWLAGLGPLAALTPWTDSNGQILSLGVGHVERIGGGSWPGGLLTLGWCKSPDREPVFGLPRVIGYAEELSFSRLVGLHPAEGAWPFTH